MSTTRTMRDGWVGMLWAWAMAVCVTGCSSRVSPPNLPPPEYEAPRAFELPVAPSPEPSAPPPAPLSEPAVIVESDAGVAPESADAASSTP